MGKTSKSKNRRYRKKCNPVGLPSVRDVELEDDETVTGCNGSGSSSKNEHIIQTILEQLGTPGVDGKLCGLTTLATLTDDHEFVEDVIKHDIIRKAGPLLVDPSSTIRNAAAVALRNLSGMGSPEICDLLVEEDVLTCVFTLLNKYYSSNWLSVSENGDSMAVDEQHHKRNDKPRRKISDKNNAAELIGDDLLTNTFVQAVHILWNLCKSSDLAVKIFNQQNILPLLARCLDPKECGIESAVAVAQCLQTVTEDNEIAAHELRHTSEDVLLKIISSSFSSVDEDKHQNRKPSKHLLLRVLAAGIVMNITKSSSDVTPVLNSRIGLAISEALVEDHKLAVNHVCSHLIKEREKSSEQDEPMEQDGSDLDYYIEETESLIAAQTIAVELLANLYFKEDEDDDWVDSDCEEMSDSEPVNNRVMMADGLPEMEEAFGGKCNIENLIKMIENDGNVQKELKSSPDTKNIIVRLNTLRSRSLLCLHNVIASLPEEDFSGFASIPTLLEKLVNIVFKEGTENATIFEAASAAMRAAVERMKKVDPKGLASNVTASSLQMLFDAEKQCSDPSTRANLIRTVGCMGETLSHSTQGETNNLLGMIGNYLLKISTQGNEELWIIAEALDALMDVFAEDSTDAAAVNIGVVDTLRSILPGL
ncbi:hypothetical protein J437_LFUL005110, partial [Ladona fulva]